MFYERDAVGVPRQWVDRIKDSIRILAPQFNTHRMVMDYVEHADMPVAAGRTRLAKDRWAGTNVLGVRKDRVRSHWDKVKIQDVDIQANAVIVAGLPVRATGEVDLDGLGPDEVTVEAVVGKLSLVDVPAPIIETKATRLSFDPNRSGPGRATFAGDLVSNATGHLGVTARIIPTHEDLVTPLDMGLVQWT